MQISLICEKCGNVFVQADDDTNLEINFYTKQISFHCRNKKCRYVNTLDLSNWKKQQERSPYPSIMTSQN